MQFEQKERDRISALLKSCRITKSVSWYEKIILPKIIANKKTYQDVADAIGCPAAFVAMIHVRESGSDVGVFKSYLGNGEPLTKVTSLVPKGRGPFSTWSEGAIDALRLVGVDKVQLWSLERMIFEWERYNGFGYRQHNVNTPYVWSFTNHYGRGHYVRDGKFDVNKSDGNIGCYALYDALVAMDSSFAVGSRTDLSDFPIIDESPNLNVIFEKLWIGFLSLLKSVFGGDKSVKAIEESRELRNKKILQVASGEIGVKEVSGLKSNPRVEAYFDATDKSGESPHKDDVPWCAAFIGWVLKQCGMGSTHSLMAQSYKVWGKSTFKAGWAPGDICVFERGSVGSGLGHVAFLLRVNADGGLVCLGGNQNDEVNITIYNPSRLIDIRRSSKEEEYTAEELKMLHTMADDIIRGKTLSVGGRMD